ncbi:hypothetical protein FM042_03865 [Aliidiomarina halalkaliphila]|uniref:Restriction endonuclease PvuRts1 I-like N-terminal domain-containing protein n=1 Tax=Aliidiomarina halalkaliphila TaxID=2593535 RepID=A0A552X4P9_9GAMM|nr:hypothetical protein [Aliidiomarina halalkaliphila]TRW49997.1 hypothetical protein FM042_03865 [Aliidiomarina halalkaliphila]
MDWKYNYLIEQLHRTAYKRHEAFIVSSLIHDSSLSKLKPCTQFYVRRTDSGYALVDIYYPQLNIAIEIDEPHHLNNKESDLSRQRHIEEHLACDFYRICIANGDVLTQLNEVKEQLRLALKKRVINNCFEEWCEPTKRSLDELKSSLSQTLFVKIKGEIHPDKLMARQTGFWRIAKDKQKHVKQVVVVHDGVISRVFSHIEWRTYDKEPHKVGYRGIENDQHELVGTVVTGWSYQQTVTYSSDLYTLKQLDTLQA